MKMKMILIVLLLTGCATSNHYHPYRHGDGFKEVQLKPNMFRVSYEGSSSAIQSADFAMLRAAELTLEQGFSHFAIVREDAGENHDFSLNHHYYLYGSHYVRTTSELHTTVVIVTYHEHHQDHGDHNDADLFDAAYVVKHFRESYQIE